MRWWKLFDEQVRLLVYGGRRYKDADAVFSAISEVNPDVVIHGGASGADYLAHIAAMAMGKPVIAMAAGWDAYGKKAGPIRNQWMLDFAAPTIAAEFAGGRGTADMRRRLQKAGIEVVVR